MEQVRDRITLNFGKVVFYQFLSVHKYFVVNIVKVYIENTVWSCKFYPCVLIVREIRIEEMVLIKVDLIYVFAVLYETHYYCYSS